MGSITRSLSNNITTGGVILPAGITNATVANITSFPNASGGTLILLSTQTASSSATISFTTGLNSTYDEYIIKYINVRPATDAVDFQFNMSTDSGSNYNVTKTSNNFIAYHFEDDSGAVLAYNPSYDLAQGTGFQTLGDQVGNGADENISGTLTIYNPSSTTFVKHFINTGNEYQYSNISINEFSAGYGNTTSAVNALQFKFTSGNIADGIFKLYGVKKS
jgi:hypothetical protein